MTAVESLADLTGEATLRATRDLCVRHRVQRLDLFGSVLTDRFDPTRSDLDMLVTFQDLPPREYADAWFGLKEDLEALLGRDVDLVTASSLKNPFFRREVEATRRTVFPIA
jgi:predicted nucleotidyltransferase